MTKHTGLHFAYLAMRSRYAAMLIGGVRCPWNGVRRCAGGLSACKCKCPCLSGTRDQHRNCKA